MARILITGGCGFIGTNLCEFLLIHGDHEVRVVDDLSVGQAAYLDEVADRTGMSVDFIHGDLCEARVLSRVLKGVDAVVHLAAKTRVVDSLRHPLLVNRVNIEGTLKLLEGCRSGGVRRIVFASSNAVLGDQEGALHERSLPRPISPYGASKLAGEAFCSAYAATFGMQAGILRFSNVFGPYCDHKPSVVAEFIRRAMELEPMIIYGDGHQTRDFIHVKDVCRAITLSLASMDEEQAKSGGNLLQVGTGAETEIIELAGIVREVAEEYGKAGPEFEFREARPGEIRRIRINVQRAEADLGFRAQVPLRQGVSETWERFGAGRSESAGTGSRSGG